MRSIHLFKRLWGHTPAIRKRQLFVLLFIMLLASCAEVTSIGAVMPFLGSLMTPEMAFSKPMMQKTIKLLGIQEPRAMLPFLTAIFVVAVLFSGLLRLILLRFQTRLGFILGVDISGEIYKKTLYQPYSVHVSRNSSDLIAGISTKTNTVIYSTLLPLLSIVSSTLILAAILFVLVIIDPNVALITFIGFGGIYSIILFITRKRLAQDGKLVSYQSGVVIKALQEGLGGIRDVLIDGSQLIFLKIYNEADFLLRQSQANIQIIGGSPRFLIEALGMAFIALLAYILSDNKSGISDSLPILGAFAVGAQRLLPVLQQLYGSWTVIRGGLASLEDVLDLLDQKSSNISDIHSTQAISFSDSIRLSNVEYRYYDSGPLILNGINITIKKGSRVGFLGITGSGKSTLVDIIMALLTPTAGSLIIDSVPVTEHNGRAWQTHIAHVPQSIFLADSTIAENIAFGIPSEKIDYDRVSWAARQAQIAATIDNWERKYDTIVGERGIRLSGGQRQRIGIARAFYKKADVIILDEATSSLDNETEKHVMEAIEKIDKNVTILIIAHRLSTLCRCDEVYEIDQGKIGRQGKFSEIVLGQKEIISQNNVL